MSVARVHPGARGLPVSGAPPTCCGSSRFQLPHRCREGVLYIGKAQEKARVQRTQRRRRPSGAIYAWLVDSTAMVNHFYFYVFDDDFGPFFLKFCSYFPYNAKLCINGHEYLKRQLTKRGIADRAYARSAEVLLRQQVVLDGIEDLVEADDDAELLVREVLQCLHDHGDHRTHAAGDAKAGDGLEDVLGQSYLMREERVAVDERSLAHRSEMTARLDVRKICVRCSCRRSPATRYREGVGRLARRVQQDAQVGVQRRARGETRRIGSVRLQRPDRPGISFPQHSGGWPHGCRSPCPAPSAAAGSTRRLSTLAAVSSRGSGA